MKSKIILVGMLGFSVLFGCNQSDEDSVKASRQGEFNVVSVDDVHRGDAVILKHEKTGCYYTYIKGGSSSTSTSLTQMTVEKNGVTVPYCED